MNGLQLSKEYYETYGKPMLEENFPDLLPYLAVGFTGSGSERWGFDDEVSRDHDFEPGFCLFLPDESIVDAKQEFRLERAYAKLPKEFMGVKRQPMSPVGGNRNGVANDKYYRTYCEIIEEVQTMCPGVKIFILEPFVLKAAATAGDWGVFKNETALRAKSAKAVAEKYGLTFVPLQAAFDALCEKAEPSYWLLDGVHPSAMGHQVIADALCEAFQKKN